MSTSTITSYPDNYVKNHINEIDITAKFIGKIEGELKNYNYKNNTNPKSRFSKLLNTGFFYITEKVLKQYNKINNLKFHVNEYFLDKDLLISFINELPEIRNQIKYNTSDSLLKSDIIDHENDERRVYDFWKKNKFLDPSLSTDPSGRSSVAILLRNNIFNANLKVIKEFFFTSKYIFYIDDIKFKIKSDPSSNLSYKVRDKYDIELASVSRPEFIENLFKNMTFLEPQIALLIQAPPFMKRKLKNNRLLIILIDMLDQLKAYADHIIEKKRAIARKKGITIDYTYSNRAININNQGTIYYKNVTLTINIYPYDERFLFPLKERCYTKKRDIFKLINDELESKLGRGTPRFNKFKLTTPRTNIRLDYKQYIRKYKLKNKNIKGGYKKNKNKNKFKKTKKYLKKYHKKYSKKQTKFLKKIRRAQLPLKSPSRH